MVTFLFRILSSLPLPIVHALGGIAGWVIYGFSPSYRRRLNANLSLAVGVPEAKALRAEAVSQAGKQAFEMPWVWLRPLEAALAQVRSVEGLELMRAATQTGRGVLVLTPHLGCFELSSLYCAKKLGVGVTVLYRPPRYSKFEPLVELGRARGGVELAPATGAGVRRLVKALHRGEIVGILPDQVPAEGEGLWAPFFGRQAWTMTLAPRLSEFKGVTVLIARCERLPKGQGFVLHIEEPQVTISGSLEARTEAINREIERAVLKNPAQYLWGYNRYKRPKGVAPRPGEPVGSAYP